MWYSHSDCCYWKQGMTGNKSTVSFCKKRNTIRLIAPLFWRRILPTAIFLIKTVNRSLYREICLKGIKCYHSQTNEETGHTIRIRARSFSNPFIMKGLYSVACERPERLMSQDILGCLYVEKGAGWVLPWQGNALPCTPYPWSLYPSLEEPANPWRQCFSPTSGDSNQSPEWPNDQKSHLGEWAKGGLGVFKAKHKAITSSPYHLLEFLSKQNWNSESGGYVCVFLYLFYFLSFF